MKQRALQTARQLGLLHTLEPLRQSWSVIKERAKNAEFRRRNPDFVPPPLAIMHDAYGSVSFAAYWSNGQYLARLLADLIRKHQPTAERVLEWGCGPGRIIRHLPTLLPSAQLFGVDYNKQSIAWCRAAIKNISFAENELSPPLPFAARHFDVIYAVSVLTHLSVAQQVAWIRELRRVAKPNGCVILTTNGEQTTTILLPKERERFWKDGVVIRGRVEDGKRCFLSYHQPAYAREHLFSHFQVIEHAPGLPGAPATEQDIWVLRPNLGNC
jgi:SAM-dependent methyltransferase